MLLPLYVSNVIALLAAFSLWGKSWLSGRWGWLKIIPWLVAALFLFQYVPESTAFISGQHVDPGLRAWENSAIVEAVQQLPKDTPVISTRPNILLLWADRPAYPLTMDFSPAFLSQSGPYGSDPQDPLQKIFRAERRGAGGFQRPLAAVHPEIWEGLRRAPGPADQRPGGVPANPGRDHLFLSQIGMQSTNIVEGAPAFPAGGLRRSKGQEQLKRALEVDNNIHAPVGRQVLG